MLNDRLRQLRKISGKTMKEVSAELGIALTTYAGYEQGVREPSICMLSKLCDYFDVSADYLIGRTDIY